jgi:hypothetical protein
MWEAFQYCEVFARRFSAPECERVIALHDESGVLRSTIPGRDSDLFWVPRTAETEWIYERVWDVAKLSIRDTGTGFPGRWASCS